MFTTESQKRSLSEQRLHFFFFFSPLRLLLAYICAALDTLTPSARRLRRRALNHLLRISGSHEEKNANMRLHRHTCVRTRAREIRTKALSVRPYGRSTALPPANLLKGQKSLRACVHVRVCACTQGGTAGRNMHKDLPEKREQGEGLF